MNRIVAVALVVGCLAVGRAAAHFPHDVVKEVGVSPSFATDGVVLAAIQLTEHKLIARSTNGGRSWAHLGRIVAEKDVQAFAFSPTFERDATVFAATRRGGVFRSDDGGVNWDAANEGLDAPNVQEVVCSARFDEDGVVFAASHRGAYRSTDRGATWEKIGLAQGPARACAAVPGSGEVFVGRTTALFRSIEGGRSWAPLGDFGDQVVGVEVSPRFEEDRTLAVVLARTGIRVSTDAGETWAEMHDGLPTPLRVKEVSVADDGTFFCVTMGAACLRADSASAAWTTFGEGFEEPAEQTDDHYHALAASPTFSTDGRVFVGAHEGFFASDDRGETWTQSNLYHQRINRLLAISPAYEDDGLVLVGNYGGGPMFWNEKTDEWSVRADGIRSLYCGILTPSPAFADDRTIFYGYMGTWRSDDAGTTWTQITPYDAITRSIAISPEFAEDGFVILNRAQAGTWRSNDRGDTWSEVRGLPKGRVNELAISPGHPADPVVFAAPAQEGLFVSTDGGESFVPLAGALDGTNVRTLALSPDFGRDGVILAGTVDHGLFRSEDRGETFVRVDTPSGEEDTLESLAFSPAFGADGVVYAVSLYDGVLASVDGGRRFRPRNVGLPHDAKRMIAVSPAFARDRTLYVSTHAWTWRSTNGARSWELLPGHLRVDDHHHTIERTGGWRVEYLPDDFAGGTAVSDKPGATETFRFYGRTVTWFARVDRDGGAAAVHLDGKFARLVDLYGSDRETNRPVFSHTFDAPGWHRIDVRVTGKKHPGSKGFAVHSDGYAHDF